MKKILAVLGLLFVGATNTLAADNSWMDQIDQTNIILGVNGQGFCSGTFIGNPKDRLILTAEHCVHDAYYEEVKKNVDPKTGVISEVRVQKKGDLEIWTNHYQDFTVVNSTHYLVKIVNSDMSTDTAILQVSDNEFVSPMTAKLAPASWKIHRGQDIFIVGNPGIIWDASVTKGIISNTQRSLDFGNGLQHFFQTDAAAIGGNSGGAVYNENGEIIGTLTGGARGTTITFIVPIQAAKDLLIKSGFNYFKE